MTLSDFDLRLIVTRSYGEVAVVIAESSQVARTKGLLSRCPSATRMCGYAKERHGLLRSVTLERSQVDSTTLIQRRVRKETPALGVHGRHLADESYLYG